MLQFQSGPSGMFPKDSCVENLISSLWCYWEVVEPLGGGIKGQEIRSLELCPGGDPGTSVSLSPCFLAAGVGLSTTFPP